MPFVYDCPTGSCHESFDYPAAAIAHADAAHPGTPLLDRMPGSFVSQERAQGRSSLYSYGCRRCGQLVESSTPPDSDVPLCDDCTRSPKENP